MAEDPDQDGWGWENGGTCRVAPIGAATNLRIDWQDRSPILRWDHAAQRPWYYEVYASTGNGPETYQGTTTSASFEDLDAGQTVRLVAVGTNENRESSASITIENQIGGSEHSYFSFIANKTRVEVDYDADEVLRTELTNLFKEFDPTLGASHPSTEGSVKRQFNSNRNVAWAILGLNQTVMNESCCGNLRLALPWNQVPELVYAEDSVGIYKGTRATDRAFYDSWNQATPEQRADYFGFDLEQLDLAAPFLEAASANLRAINHYRSEQSRMFGAVLTGLALAVFTAGMLPPGTSLLAQGATFGAVSAGTTTLLIEGDLASAIEAAAEGAFWGGITGLVQGATGVKKVLGSVVVEAGKAYVNGEDPEKAALAALRGEAISALASNITTETLRSQTVESLTPVFGTRTATDLVNFAANTSTQIMAELSVLYMIDDSIDLGAEADRIFWAHFSARVGEEVTTIVAPINDHIGNAVGAVVTTGMLNDWDESKMNEAALRALVPLVTEWVADELPDNYELTELIVLAIGEVVGELDETPSTDELTNQVIDRINELTGLEIERRT